MTFGEYVNAFASTGLFEKEKIKVGVRLFSAAGPCDSPSGDTIKAWINGKRNCNVARYFPDGQINQIQFIKYLKSMTKGENTWKKLQRAFSSLKSESSEDDDFRVDLETDNSNVFYWSLLNQFQKIYHLPETEFEGNSSVFVTDVRQSEPSNEQIRDFFVKSVCQYGVMDIINKKPAILNRNDSTNLNVFLDRIDEIIPYRNPYDISLYSSMRSFIEALRIQVLTLDANLNNRFSIEDETASFNMENDEDCSQIRNDIGLPELTPEIIKSAADPIALANIYVKEWRNFRDKMNCLFKDISSWKSAE